MPYKKITKTIPFEAKEIYNIVLDVKKYPEFLPYCQAVTIDFNSQSEILATMTLEIPTPLKKITVQYQSCIEASDFNNTIAVQNAQKESIFKFMKSFWHMKPCITGCEITYEITFELQNPFLNLTLSSLFLNHSEMIVNAFIARAKSTLKPVV